MSSEYYIDLDEQEWIGVPSAFPCGEWADAEAWAAALSAASVPGGGAEREAFRRAALDIAGYRPPDIDAVLWFAPHDGRAMGVAFLTVMELDGDSIDLDELASAGIDSATPPQTMRHRSETLGEIVQSAATIRLADVADVAEGTAAMGGVAGSIRTLAAAGGLVFMLNAVDEDLTTLAYMQQPMLDLLGSIRLVDDADLDATARELAGTADGERSKLDGE